MTYVCVALDSLNLVRRHAYFIYQIIIIIITILILISLLYVLICNMVQAINTNYKIDQYTKRNYNTNCK